MFVFWVNYTKGRIEEDLYSIYISNPDPGESDTVRKPVPGHNQADLLDDENLVPGQHNQPDLDNRILIKDN